ncbi:o-succinylbenzoate--CoA ligase [Jongsikchunia kroppenstedtii]|uniref:o-succinylbenzoate--CoA ligase n=1 Tax=Jongsikchunia kroppenstedtii TaxID=1121721 RepID=UPI00068567EF|nr:o-succinylbenzoate--CoA ligase [Jongsikchunia kroppenstedtii]
MTVLRPLALGGPDSIRAAIPLLTAALDGEASLLPVPDGDAVTAALLRDALGPDEPIDDAVALVVATSGSTGTPKGAMLTAAALRASADATHARLGGPGSWLLALPPQHIAGLQVLLRSLAAGHEPVILDVTTGFEPASLTAAIDTMPAGRRYTSLVPGQLVKVLDDPDATAALAAVDGVLVGGAATPPALRAKAIAAGVPVVRTYGMSETCGGCVYDGVPLDGVDIVLDDENPDGVGRVRLGGATVALGYRNQPDHPAFARPGWFRTDDLGTLTDGVLAIAGRADEAISSGGLTVLPQVVEAQLTRLPGIAECAVFGLPHERLGQQIAAAVVAAPGHDTPTVDRLRAELDGLLPTTSIPRQVFTVDELPLRGPGKVDRRALVNRFSQV